MGRRAIEQALREMEWEKAAQKSLDEALRHAYALLNAQGIRYDKQFVAAKLKKDSMRWGVAEDIGKILWNVAERVKFKPRDLDHFFGYVVVCMKFPPFEPISHLRQRHGKKALEPREWKFLMDIRRHPHAIREHPPEWLDGALQSSASFAKVYELEVSRAREILGQKDDDGFLDTARKTTFADTGKSLMDVDDTEFLRHLESFLPDKERA